MVLRPRLLRFSFCLAVMAVMALANSARAAFTFTVYEVPFTPRPTVRIEGGGTLNLTDLVFQTSGYIMSADVLPNLGYLLSGTPNMVSYYRGVSGPSQIGPSVFMTQASYSVGGITGIAGRDLLVYSDYVPGAYLGSDSLYFDQTIASLGLTPGSYVWTWGSGENADSLTINVVPEPSTYALMALGAGVVLWGLRRRRVV